MLEAKYLAADIADVRRLGKRRRGMPQNLSRTSESADDQISVIRRSAALVAVDEFAREAEIVSSPLYGPQTAEGSGVHVGYTIEPLPDPQKGPQRPWLNSPCQTVVRQAVLAAATR